MTTSTKKSPATKKERPRIKAQVHDKISKLDKPKDDEKKSTQFHFLRS